MVLSISGLELRFRDVVYFNAITVIENNLLAVLVTEIQRVSHNFLGVFFGLCLHADSDTAYRCQYIIGLQVGLRRTVTLDAPATVLLLNVGGMLTPAAVNRVF